MGEQDKRERRVRLANTWMKPGYIEPEALEAQGDYGYEHLWNTWMWAYDQDVTELRDRVEALEAELARERGKSHRVGGEKMLEKVLRSSDANTPEFADDLHAAGQEFKRMRAALEASRHALTTLHGLYAHDGKPEHTWRLDLQDDLARVDAALEGRGA